MICYLSYPVSNISKDDRPPCILTPKMTTHQSNQAMLPVPNPTPSYWRSVPHHLDSHRSTPDLPGTSDIVIIGAGLTDVSAA